MYGVRPRLLLPYWMCLDSYLSPRKQHTDSRAAIGRDLISLLLFSHCHSFRNVANQYPALFESLIVLSYHTYLPGELAWKWGGKSSWNIIPFARRNPSRSRTRQYTLAAMLVTVLQSVGALSPSIQKLVIHTVQPFVVSSLYLLFHVLRAHPIMLTLVASVAVFGAGYTIWGYLRDSSQETEEQNRIFPIREIQTEIAANGSESVAHHENINSFEVVSVQAPSQKHPQAPPPRVHLERDFSSNYMTGTDSHQAERQPSSDGSSSESNDSDYHVLAICLPNPSSSDPSTSRIHAAPSVRDILISSPEQSTIGSSESSVSEEETDSSGCEWLDDLISSSSNSTDSS
jgi:hypothetical protein